jgi:hypothetical protein
MRFLGVGAVPVVVDEAPGSVDEDCDPEMTIHMRFQSVCPATRMSTHPSIRPRTRVVRVSLPEIYDVSVEHTAIRELTFKQRYAY